MDGVLGPVAGLIGVASGSFNVEWTWVCKPQLSSVGERLEAPQLRARWWMAAGWRQSLTDSLWTQLVR
jgi:hypothetical protein